MDQPPYTALEVDRATTIATCYAQYGIDEVCRRITEAKLPLDDLRAHVRAHAAAELSRQREHHAALAYQEALFSVDPADIKAKGDEYKAARDAVLPCPPRFPPDLAGWLQIENDRHLMGLRSQLLPPHRPRALLHNSTTRTGRSVVSLPMIDS